MRRAQGFAVVVESKKMPAMYFIIFKEVLDLFENPVVVVTDQKEPF